MSPFLAKLILLIFGLSCVLLFFHIMGDIQTLQAEWQQPKQRPQRGYVRQHGDYMVWHEYLRAEQIYESNQSLTLTTHATYMDLGLLPTMLSRWQAPISLTIYASGSDFYKAIESFWYIHDCLQMRRLLRHFVSIHLVWHRQHYPPGLHLFDLSRAPPASLKCHQPAPYAKARQDVTYWHLHKLKYPVNLLRNVARLNAYTYYIMALDMQLLPPSNFAKKFIHFAWVRYWNHPDIAKPFASIYCLPTFPHTPQAPLAYNKQQLVKVLRDYNITKPIYNNNYLWQRNWLSSVKDQEHLYIYDRATHGICVGYISINELEPLYDEQYEMESIYQANNNLQCLLLSHLGYSFIIMDNVFLIRRTEDSWQSIRYNKTLRFARLHRLNKLKKLYNNLVSLPGVNNNLEWLINMAKKD
ncbi:beta-1,4-glucuronyltransferase 1 [Drosophila busckii]|uniref:beta-1,4-glucuronyltransferase 1 n=1 Tax=Drosophila busckii TaxID=30019 RepID=UPI00083EA01E|nr:beta-1,4-glucuronyltransferase 1 [Drosophila busckii]